MSRLSRFFEASPQDVHASADTEAARKSFFKRPMGRVMLGVGLVAGAGLLVAAAPASAAAAAPAMLASAGNTAGAWKAAGIFALAVAYVWGNVQAAMALSRAFENRERKRQADEAKAKAIKDKLDALKRDLEKPIKADDDNGPDNPGGDPAPKAEDGPDMLSRIDRRRPVLRVRRKLALPRL